MRTPEKASPVGRQPGFSAGAVLISALVALAGWPRPEPSAGREWTAMGTFAAVSVAAEERANLDRYAAAASNVLRELEGKFRVFDPESEISRLNQAAGKDAVPVSAPTAAVLGLALKYGEISGGAFDITVGPLMALWGFRGGPALEAPPPPAAVAEALRTVGDGHLIRSEQGARLDLPGVKVDLGGIAKGYAVDVCYERLRGMGARNLMLNLGGNIRCGGRPQGYPAWRIGVRNPFDTGQTVGVLTLTDGQATATSGDYERFVTIAGERYGHIMDPRTGRPAQGMAGVTVVATNAVGADALSTTLFVLGMAESRRVLDRLPAVQALFVPDRRPLEIWITPGLKARFTPHAEFEKRVWIVE